MVNPHMFGGRNISKADLSAEMARLRKRMNNPIDDVMEGEVCSLCSCSTISNHFKGCCLPLHQTAPEKDLRTDRKMVTPTEKDLRTDQKMVVWLDRCVMQR